MLRFIVQARTHFWPGLQEIIHSESDGNPKAQARLLRKIEKACGRFLCDSNLKAGKRGRYEIDLLLVEGWDAETRTIVADEEAIPERPWLALTATRLRGTGHRAYEQNTDILIFVTHHALSRLAQRCDARTVVEIYEAVLAIMHRYIKMVVLETKDELPDNFRMRVRLPHGDVICPLRRYNDEKGGLVVATLWNEGECDE
jgi:hypothetical protein